MATKRDSGDTRKEQQIANDEQIAKVSDLTDPAVVVDSEQPKAVKVKSPTGHVTEVPEGIVQALLDSGYSKTR